MAVEVIEGRLLTEARCTACRAELAVYSDDPPLVRRAVEKFKQRHGGHHEKSSDR